MAPRKKDKVAVQGAQMLARGDVIHVMDQGAVVRCRVLSVIAAESGGCFAALEILEGERKGQRIETLLRPRDPEPHEPRSG